MTNLVVSSPMVLMFDLMCTLYLFIPVILLFCWANGCWTTKFTGQNSHEGMRVTYTNEVGGQVKARSWWYSFNCFIFLINGENVNSDPGTDSPQPSPSTVLMKDYWPRNVNRRWVSSAFSDYNARALFCKRMFLTICLCKYTWRHYPNNLGLLWKSLVKVRNTAAKIQSWNSVEFE